MKHFLTILLILTCTASFAQVSNIDSLTNEPLNALNNIIQGNSSKNITIGAYAQIDYNQELESGVRHNGNMDVHRLVTFLGYRFDDRTHFVMEIEYEHVSEVFVEQAFLNYKIKPNFNVRAGLMLIPMGIINEYHEPPTYFGVERPNLESTIIPTTWRELGVGVSGSFPSTSLKYQLYVVNGFSGYNGSGNFRGSDGFRKGRQKAAESFISTPNLSSKLDYYGLPGLKLGLAGYFGKSQSTLFDGLDKDNDVMIDQADSSVVSIAMVGFDARYQYKGFTARAVVVNANINNTDEYNAFVGSDLGSRMFGYYVEGGYDVLRFFKQKTDKRLDVFARYEKYNTHEEVDLIAKNESYNRTDITLGLGYKIAPGAVLKADYQIQKNDASGSKDKKVLNFGIGIWF
ncbi:MAG TPA: hypothetical protein PKL31_08905 [Fulvivirga sp.]|nr:hypothetical protein [Fulvivirga sp.]